jgi:hypothetical protein
MKAFGHDSRAGKQVPARCDESKTRDIALFGMRGGVAWIAEDAFVTREGDDILVEKWVGHRAVSILVRRPSAASLADLWSRLLERAGDAQVFPTPPQPRQGFA